jgi:Ca-activated chloride channel family protein
VANVPPDPGDPVAGLIDIPLPPSIGLWPETWTSRITVAGALVALVVSMIWMVHRRWVNRYRREALAELDRIVQPVSDPVQLAQNLAMLVRRTALAAFPRQQVVQLTGPAWLAFLDRTYGGTEFSQGAGRSLEIAAYRPVGSARDRDQRLLIELVRRWIKAHHA